MAEIGKLRIISGVYLWNGNNQPGLRRIRRAVLWARRISQIAGCGDRGLERVVSANNIC
jgi:hypothetical protein